MALPTRAHAGIQPRAQAHPAQHRPNQRQLEIAPLSALNRQWSAVEPNAVKASSTVSSRFEPLVSYLPGVSRGGGGWPDRWQLGLLATGLIGGGAAPALEPCCWKPARSAQRCCGTGGGVPVSPAESAWRSVTRSSPAVLIGVFRPDSLAHRAASSGWSMEQSRDAAPATSSPTSAAASNPRDLRAAARGNRCSFFHPVRLVDFRLDQPPRREPAATGSWSNTTGHRSLCRPMPRGTRRSRPECRRYQRSAMSPGALRSRPGFVAFLTCRTDRWS